MGGKKYELTDETKTLADGTVLHCIRAVRDFVLVDGTRVHVGDLGGWVEREDNLSQDGSAWVGDDAEVCGSAKVENDAWVGGKALVCDRALIYDNARIYGNALVCDNVEVYGKAEVYEKARVYGKAEVCGNAWVGGEARIYEDVRVSGCAEVCGNAQVKSLNDYVVFKNAWSSGRYFTYTSSNKMWKVGCFYGTGEELIAKAYGDSKLSGRCYEAIVRAQEAVDRAVEEEAKVK